jgi:hypothetical protein
MRNATKQDLVAQLSRVLKTSDLSKGQVRGVYGAWGRVMIWGTGIVLALVMVRAAFCPRAEAGPSLTYGA